MFLFRLIVKSGEGAAWSAFGASDKALSYSVFRPLFWCPAPSRWNEGAGDEASKSYRCHTPATSRKPPSQVRPDRNPTDNLSVTTTYVNYTFVIKNQQMPLKFLINPLVPASTKSEVVFLIRFLKSWGKNLYMSKFSEDVWPPTIPNNYYFLPFMRSTSVVLSSTPTALAVIMTARQGGEGAIDQNSSIS